MQKEAAVSRSLILTISLTAVLAFVGVAPAQGPSKAAPKAGAPKPTVSVAPVSPDVAKMPDVVGVHLGMGINQAAAALQSNYPGQRIEPSGDRFPGINGNVNLSLAIHVPGAAQDNVWVDVLPPPNTQIVWRVSRQSNTPNQPIGREALLAALRQKYHKESIAYTNTIGSGGVVTKNDDEIGQLIWAFDAQGQNVAIPDGVLEQSKCEGPFLAPGDMSPSWYTEEARGVSTATNSDPRVATNSWCATSGIFVSVTLVNLRNGDSKFIGSTITSMVNLPLGVKAEKATTAWWIDTVGKLRQKQITESNQVKPKL